MAAENICKIVQGYLCGQGRPLYLQPKNSDGTYPWLETCSSTDVGSTTLDRAPLAKADTPSRKRFAEGGSGVVVAKKKSRA